MQTIETEMRLENIVLGQAINQPSDIDEISQFIPNGDVFVQGRARRLWEIIEGMHRDKSKIDLLTVTSKLTPYDGEEGVDNLYIVDVTIAASYGAYEKDITHAKLMYEKYLLRKVSTEARRIESLASNNSGKVYEAIEEAHKHLGMILELKPDENFSIDKELVSAINSITDKESLLVKTSYKNLDRLAGGLTKGEITIIGGRPCHG